MIVITAHGRLAHQPEVRIGKQTSVCEFRLLSNRYARGEEHTEAVTFFCYGEEAEAFCERTERGQLISATGTQETQRWRDSSGQERISIKYRLTWWEAGPRPKKSRVQQAAASESTTPSPLTDHRQPHPTLVPARVRGSTRPADQQDEPPDVPGLI